MTPMYIDPPNHCPICGALLAPHAGPEDGPATHWAHADAADDRQACKWDGWEGLSNHQLSMQRAAIARKQKIISTAAGGGDDAAAKIA